MSQQQYTEYKESGVEGLGKIPVHWKVQKMKFLGNIYAGLKEKNGDDFQGVEKECEIKPFIPFSNICNHPYVKENNYQYVKILAFEDQNKVLPNDLLFLMSSEIEEDVGKCALYLGKHHRELYLNSFCKGFRIQCKEVVPNYLNYLLKSDFYQQYFSKLGRGFTRINIKQEYILNVRIILPPLEEQYKIASFLDQKYEQIKEAILEKEQFILLLNERKKKIIQQAVNKGLDKTITLKESSVKWIGKIPIYWEVKKIKYITSKIGSGMTPTGKNAMCLDQQGIPFLRSQNVHFGGFKLDNVAYITAETHQEMHNSQVKKGDVLLNITGKSVGRCHYVEEEIPMNVNQHVCIVRPTKAVSTPFLNYLLTSEICQHQLLFFQQGGAKEGLTFSALRNISVPLPPILEQKKIVQYITEESAQIEELISLQQEQIKILEEYKFVLTNTLVMGRIKL